MELTNTKIGIDFRFCTKSKRGLGYYSYWLLKNMCGKDTGYDFYFFADEHSDASAFKDLDNVQIITIPIKNYFIWEQILLPFYLKKYKISLYHGLGNTLPIFTPKRTKLILTIADVMFLKKELDTTGSVKQLLGKIYRKNVFQFITKKARKIIAISDFTKQDILSESEIEANKIETIWLSYNEATNTETTKKKIAETSVPYFLTMGATDPRKNTNRIIEAFETIADKIPHRVYVIGYQSGSKSKLFQNLSPQMKERIFFFDYIPDQDLCVLFKNADAFLYLSLYEGFGLPLLDAMYHKCPVLCSNVTSIPEIVGEAALLANPYDEKDIAEKMLLIANDKTLKEDLKNKGVERLKFFSWQKTAEATLKVYESV
jgi:glycosyltransferase involved in cell wall biosynthesis